MQEYQTISGIVKVTDYFSGPSGYHESSDIRIGSNNLDSLILKLEEKGFKLDRENSSKVVRYRNHFSEWDSKLNIEDKVTKENTLSYNLQGNFSGIDQQHYGIPNVEIDIKNHVLRQSNSPPEIIGGQIEGENGVIANISIKGNYDILDMANAYSILANTINDFFDPIKKIKNFTEIEDFLK